MQRGGGCRLHTQYVRRYADRARGPGGTHVHRRTEKIMTKPIATSGPVVVLRKPKTNAALLIYAKALLAGFKGNQSFPDPTPSMAVFEADVNAFDDAEAAAKGRGPAATKARNARKHKVEQDMDHLRDYAQLVVETIADIPTAISMIIALGMGVQRKTKRNKAVLAASRGTTSGTVVLVARAVASSAAV